MTGQGMTIQWQLYTEKKQGQCRGDKAEHQENISSATQVLMQKAKGFQGSRTVTSKNQRVASGMVRCLTRRNIRLNMVRKSTITGKAPK